MNTLRIATWNANGLLNHKQEVITFLNLKILMSYELKIPFVKNEILRMAERYKGQTANHDNELIEELYINGPVIRRLNRTWP
jgi:hypothetical protein